MGICDLLQLHSVTRKTSSLLGDMGSGKRLNDVIPIHHHIPKKCLHIMTSRASIWKVFFSLAPAYPDHSSPTIYHQLRLHL